MTIEEHIKNAMAECPLTEQQEDKLLIGIENYLNEIEQVKNLNIPAVVGRSEQLKSFMQWHRQGFNTYNKMSIDEVIREYEKTL